MKAKVSHREAMFLKIEQWRQSGLAQIHFCDQQAIPYHVFHYWYKRWRDQSNAIKINGPSFVHLQVKEERDLPLMELSFSNGSRLIFYQPVGSDYLKALIG